MINTDKIMKEALEYAQAYRWEAHSIIGTSPETGIVESQEEADSIVSEKISNGFAFGSTTPLIPSDAVYFIIQRFAGDSSV